VQKYRLWIILLLTLCLLYPDVMAETKVAMTFAGDCTLGGEDKLAQKDASFASYAKKEGYDYFFSQVKDLFSTDDVTVVNLEGVLKADFYGKIPKKFICFRGLPEYTAMLTSGSVEAVNLANNHAGDYGDGGRASTMQALTDAGVGYFNAENVYLFKKNGVNIAFCGFWCTAYQRDGAQFRETVRKLKQQGANAVVVSLHFGQEYHTLHNTAQTSIAHAMIDAGADLVIGHHPHVAQGLEIYRDRTILYSLGNFVFGGNAQVRSQPCLIGRVTLTFGAEGEYQAQQLRLYAANMSGTEGENNYQPHLVNGEDAAAVFAQVDADTPTMPAPVAEQNGWREYPTVFAQPGVTAQ